MNGFLKKSVTNVKEFTVVRQKIASCSCTVSDEVITFARRGICVVQSVAVY